MIKYEDECVQCANEKGCLGKACPYANVAHYYCDKCGYECDELYILYDEELCAECVLESLEKVE